MSDDRRRRFKLDRETSTLELKIERDYNDVFDDLPPGIAGAHEASATTMFEASISMQPIHVEPGLTLREIVDGLLDSRRRKPKITRPPEGPYKSRGKASTKRQPTSRRLEFFLRCAMIELEKALSEADDAQATHASALILLAATHSCLSLNGNAPSPLIGAAREALCAFKSLEPEPHVNHEAAWTPLTRANWARKIRQEIAGELERSWPPATWTPDGDVPVPEDEWAEWADHEGQLAFDVVVRSMRFMVDAPELQRLALPSNVAKSRAGVVRSLKRYLEETRRPDAETVIRKVLTALGYPARSAYSLWEADSVKSKRDARKPSSD